MSLNNVDDLLTQASMANESASTAVTEEIKPVASQMPMDNGDLEYEINPEVGESEEIPSVDDSSEEPSLDLDEYGNEKPKPRTYTEEEVNERINKAVRDRLARGNAPASEQTYPVAQTPAEGDAWEHQLEAFVEQTVSKMGQKEAQRIAQFKAQQEEAALGHKINEAAERFSDFRSVVKAEIMTDAMTRSLIDFKDPGAFIYAAFKTSPQELKRISEISNPYAQAAEMGKLEERMRKSRKTQSNAPRPIERTQEDTIPKDKIKKERPVDILAQEDSRRLATVRAIRGR